jgi:hypothetical protein
MSSFPFNRRALGRKFAQVGRPVAVFVKDAGHGLFEVCHNSLAMVGLVVVALSLFFVNRADLRHTVEESAFGWLQTRHIARIDADDSPAGLARALAESNAVTRVTALDPKGLDREQAAIASWLARRYSVAPEPLSRLVQEAWAVGQRAKLEPTLILAVMAIESRFNPFAQSPVGAQGLMQVMTTIHDEKYEAFGGNHAAFDPVTNLRVGVQILKECIARAGSLEGGLKYYVGAANLPHDGGYAGKVLAEQAHLLSVAAGRRVAVTAPLIPAPRVEPATPSTEAAAPGAPADKPADAAPSERVALN